MTKQDHQNPTQPSNPESINAMSPPQPDDVPEQEFAANRGLEDWEMVEKMSEPQPGVAAWTRIVVGSVIAGIAVFIAFAYALDYLMKHYGRHLL